MKYLILLFITFTAGLFSEPLSWIEELPEGFSIDISLSNDQVSSDKKIEVRGKISYPNGYELSYNPLITGKSTPLKHNFTAQNIVLTPPESSGTTTSQNLILTLVPWKAGRIPFSVGSFTFTSSSGEKFTHYSRVITIPVTHLNEPIAEIALENKLFPLTKSSQLSLSEENREKLVEGEQVVDDQKKKNLERLKRGELPWRALLLLALCAIAIYYLVNKKRQLNQAAEEERLSPREKALQALDNLEQKGLAELGQFDRFYVELTFIIRSYMEERFDLHAPEQTTEEFLKDLSKSELFHNELKRGIKGFFFHADLIKFAQIETTVKECKDALNSGRELILVKVDTLYPSRFEI